MVPVSLFPRNNRHFPLVPKIKILIFYVPGSPKLTLLGAAGCGGGVVYLISPGRPTDIGKQLGKACYPCSR